MFYFSGKASKHGSIPRLERLCFVGTVRLGCVSSHLIVSGDIAVTQHLARHRVKIELHEITTWKVIGCCGIIRCNIGHDLSSKLLPLRQTTTRLQVNVAQGSVGRAHQVSHLDGWAGSEVKVNGGIESSVS